MFAGAMRAPDSYECAVLELIVISTLNGVLFGMLLFLLSSGLTVIFSMMGVLNFAHASFYMLGAFFGYQLTRWLGFWSARSAWRSSATACATRTSTDMLPNSC